MLFRVVTLDVPEDLHCPKLILHIFDRLFELLDLNGIAVLV